MNLIEQYIGQTQARHGRVPERLLVTPLAAAAIAAKGVSIHPEMYGVKVSVLDPRDAFETRETCTGKVVALILEETGIYTTLRLVDVE